MLRPWRSIQYMWFAVLRGLHFLVLRTSKEGNNCEVMYVLLKLMMRWCFQGDNLDNDSDESEYPWQRAIVSNAGRNDISLFKTQHKIGILSFYLSILHTTQWSER